VHHQDLELRDADERAEGGERVAAVGQGVEGFYVIEPVLAELAVAVIVGDAVPLIPASSEVPRNRRVIVC
jgi:hypothetical protein